ncbi:DUF3011 domain-containing protein [Argonema antarcticum A004/B2]|nr:DUF3011 domain-containing protein [Argonema antarcticum A004/B2]
MVNRFSAIATALAISIGTVFAAGIPAEAQRIITCQSNNRERTFCRVNTNGGVRLVRQLSNSRCNGNWGYDRNRIWVRNGCRAEFAVGNRRNDRYNSNDRYNRNDRYNQNDRYRR